MCQLGSGSRETLFSEFGSSSALGDRWSSRCLGLRDFGCFYTYSFGFRSLRLEVGLERGWLTGLVVDVGVGVADVGAAHWH